MSTCSCWECEQGAEFRFEDNGKTLIVGDTLYRVTRAMRVGAIDHINQVPWNLAPHRPDTNARHDWEAGHELASCPSIAWQLAGMKRQTRYKAGDAVLVLMSWSANKVWAEAKVNCVMIRGEPSKRPDWCYQVDLLLGGSRIVPAWRLQPVDVITKMGDLIR